MGAYELHTYERERFTRFVDSQTWQYFGTITAKHELTEKSARRVADVLKSRIESAGQHHAYASGEGAPFFWVAEPHKHASDGFHLHFLLTLPSRFASIGRRTKWEFLLDSCRRSVGGEPWISSKGKLGLWHRVQLDDYRGMTAAQYCAKYVTKDLHDWDFFRIF